MTFNNLRDMLKTLHDILIHRTLLKVDTHIGTCRVSQALWINIESATSNYLSLDKVLNTLVNSST